MHKKGEKMSIIYSPNFTKKKRTKFEVKYLVFHYTGMKSEKGAIRKLTNLKSSLSSHYFIKKNGEIIQFVPDLYIAWHAGVSYWKKDKLLNSKSIGIEISNPGHQYGYKNFNYKQIKSIKKISKKLIKKYKIKKENILGHSDVAPLRKKDPGEKFPWKLLARHKIGQWHHIKDKKCKVSRRLKLINNEKLYKLLFKFGYFFSKKPLDRIKILKSFQRRFRPELINGLADEECYLIIKSML